MHRGYRYEREKFEISGLTPVRSETLEAPRVRECPVQLEAKVEGLHHLAEHDTAQCGRVLVIEVCIQRVHLEESILMPGEHDRMDPDERRSRRLCIGDRT
jgi:flavin reductase (DIM6/NTAB) family NADH-FMN oxidoreductase RutF